MTPAVTRKAGNEEGEGAGARNPAPPQLGPYYLPLSVALRFDFLALYFCIRIRDPQPSVQNRWSLRLARKPRPQLAQIR